MLSVAVTDATPDLLNGEPIAAVDLGSNSFHMVVARHEHGQLRIIDRLRDPVRIGMGLGTDGSLSMESRQRALASLACFGERLRAIPHDRVHAVATNTLRQMAEPQAFLVLAETALGHPIEIVSGREEARLIYLGVAHHLPASEQQRLVIDIGGGSTEFIIGRGLHALHTESAQMGSIASSRAFFGDGRIDLRRWQRGRTAIALTLQRFAADYRQQGWGEAIASSGTARSIASILEANGWGGQHIDMASLERLRDILLEAGDMAALDQLPGLTAERRALLAGGVLIMHTAAEVLGLDKVLVCDAAMREGLLHELIGRTRNASPRSESIQGLASRYAVDRRQAERVGHSALALFDQVCTDWQLGSDERNLLSWAAQVHEIGLAIAHNKHQAHGAYIIEHSHLPGFGQLTQHMLAVMVRNHRRKPKAQLLETLPARLQDTTRRLTALLRLAALLQRSRTDAVPEPVDLHGHGDSLQVQLPAGWLAAHPLTRADLQQERNWLQHLGVELMVSAGKTDTIASTVPNRQRQPMR